MDQLSVGSGMQSRQDQRESVRRFQEILGVYNDGLFGPNTLAGARERLGLFGIPFNGVVNSQVWELLLDTIGYLELPWGSKVSTDFKQRVREICTGLDLNPSHLMNCMAFETGETFRADIRNAAGSGATGLIQFMPFTAKALGYTTDELADMTPEQQLSVVYKYFYPFRGSLTTLEDVYMAILYPAAVGKPRNFRLFLGGTIAYRQNSGLDVDRDNDVEKWEAARMIYGKVRRGNIAAG